MKWYNSSITIIKMVKINPIELLFSEYYQLLLHSYRKTGSVLLDYR